MSNVNQWAFEAITGYPGGAPVDGWREMSDEALISEIEAQVEHYAPADISGTLDTQAVLRAITAAKQAESSHDWYLAHASLAEGE